MCESGHGNKGDMNGLFKINLCFSRRLELLLLSIVFRPVDWPQLSFKGGGILFVERDKEVCLLFHSCELISLVILCQ